jgi:TonB family protein
MSWWQYLTLVNIYLLLFYSFYVLLLSRERFFYLNRIYLVSAAILSLIIPGIQSNWVKGLFITQKVQYTIYSSPVLLYRFKPAAASHFSIGQMIGAFYLLVLTFLLSRFVWQLISLKRMMRQQQSPAAYSFFKKVTLGQDRLHHQVISAHENAHAREWHSVDVLMMEALVILNWFNPIVYLYRLAIRHIHEFIADRQALETGIAKADYALILLSQTFNTPTHQLVTGFFNKSLLKQRIAMLQKNKSSRVALAKYFLSAPLFMLMLILSSATVDTRSALTLINNKVRLELSLTAKVLTTPELKRQADSLWTRVVEDIPEQKKPIPIARTARGPANNNTVFEAVEQAPQFPGGFSEFWKFLASNIKYPAAAKERNIQGRVVVNFIVEADGALDHFKVVKGIGYGADEEALRVFALSPKWKPGIQNNRPVRVSYTVPIMFTLDTSVQAEKPVPKVITGNLMLSQPAATDTGKTAATKTLPKAIDLTIRIPLYIVDGEEQNDIKNINPKDIKSITVLKDKSADFYGAKGANGVVLVVTKKSKPEPAPNLIIKN